jgi:hypothetical protein
MKAYGHYFTAASSLASGKMENAVQPSVGAKNEVTTRRGLRTI